MFIRLKKSILSWDFKKNRLRHFQFCIAAIAIICLYFSWRKTFITCDCNATIPKDFRLKNLSNGIHYTKYEKEIGEAFHTDKVLFEKLFKLHVAKYSNISGSIINFKEEPKKIYRSAILSENLALLSELVKERNVKSIVVLTNSKIFDINPMINKEREFFSVLGGKQFNHILNFNCDFDFNDDQQVKEARSKVASIIKLIQNSEGDVLIHCLGGEHRSEVVFEVMQMCFNKSNMDDITNRYKCHTGWRSETSIGNYRKENLDFIRDFPCELL